MPKSPPQAAGRGRPKSRPGLRVVSRAGTPTLYLRGTVRGVSVYESTGTDNPDLAEEARATREAELYRGALHGTKGTKTFAQAALLYLKRPTDGRPISTQTKVLINRLAQHFGQTIRCDEIDQDAIDAAARALCRKDAKAVTVLRSITTPAKSILMYASRRGWCPIPAFETAKGGGKRTDWFTPDEAERMIGAASKHLKPMLAFLFCTGARLGEALALSWEDVDLRHARAVLRETKNGDDRIVDLPPRAVAALANIEGERTGRVFLDPKKRAYRLTDESKSGSGGGQIKRAWGTAMAGAGITRHMTPHHARHSFATWHYSVHKDLVKLRIDGGWRTIAMCERYTKLAGDWMRDEVLAFWSSAPIICAVDVQTEQQDRLTA